MNCSVFAFLLVAFSTISNIFATVEFSYVFETRIVKTAVWLMQPDKSESCIDTSLGKVSPVNAEVSTAEAPSTIIPSTGTFSPTRIKIRSSILSSSGRTFIVILSSTILFAYSTRMC